MQLVTITSQGQMTLPAYLRRKYNFDSTNKVLVKEENNQVIVEPVSDVMALAGSLKKYALNKPAKKVQKIEKTALAKERAKAYKAKSKQTNISVV